MILLDAIHINNGGGKILLDYLISNLHNKNKEFVFLLDERVKLKHPVIQHHKVIYLKASYSNRYRFYKKNKSVFTKVLCFANLPPNVKLDGMVYTYFHNPIYLSFPKDLPLITKIKFALKIIVLKWVLKNTNYWLVQSDLMKRQLMNKFGLNEESLMVIPFHVPFEQLAFCLNRERYTYLYVSNATTHKNHNRLIEAFCLFYDKFKIGRLILTLNNDYSETINKIEALIQMGYPIKNIGFVDRLQLQKMYLSTEYLVFPSLAESFGLGLIEAIECGCKVIGADLPYTYEVCEPSIVFNPLDVKSIFNAFVKSIDYQSVPPSKPLIKNRIDELINLLIE